MKCVACDGECEYTGALGNRHHYRCTACGLDNSSTLGPVDQEQDFPEEAVEES